MKKYLYLSFAALLMIMTGCSNEDVDGAMNGDGSTDRRSYLAVTIAPNVPDTRAENSDAENEDKNNYEKGSEAENKITSVRFYFFDSEGGIAKVKRNSEGEMVNFLDVNVIPGDKNEDMPNVEKGLQATLVINTAQGDERPARILAVCNRSNRLSNASADLATVRNTIYDYAGFAQNSNQFVMSSAVYASADNQVVSAVTIPEECFQDQESGAMLNPVVLYVERVVAKVEVKLDAEKLGTITVKEGETNYILVPLKKKKNVDGGEAVPEDIIIDEKQVYAKFLGWNVTAATVQSSLSKHINPAWTIFPAWNYAPFFRSYWARNCEGAGTRYMPFMQNESKADETSNENGYAVTKGKELTTAFTQMYTNENAAAYMNNTTGIGRAYPSTVIMAAQLCDKDGKAIDVYRWLGHVKPGGEDMVTEILSELEITDNLIYYKESGAETSIKAISKEDIKLVTAAAAGKAHISESSSGRYNTYAILSVAGEGKAWYSREDCKEEDRLTVTQVNQYLNDKIGPIEVWNNGYTYYYFPIRHIGKLGENGENMGYYGVVRNHIYRTNINSIFGLGTPVYDPYETIIPEKPDNSNTYVAAQINILSWRVVANDVELDWDE